MEWSQIFVDGTNVPASSITALEPTIERFGALPVAPPPSGVPVLNSQGEYEIRCLNPGFATMVKTMIEQYGFTVTRVVKN
jgi:hypothetical protein